MHVLPFVDFVLTRNTGISYGLFQQSGPLGQWVLLGFKAIAVAVLWIWLSRADSKLTALSLGLINVEQNNIIKIFSVAAVLFLPPTLIASIYGMNYHLLPDLPGKYSNFFFSLGLMVASMGVTYALFKRKGWL